MRYKITKHTQVNGHEYYTVHVKSFLRWTSIDEKGIEDGYTCNSEFVSREHALLGIDKHYERRLNKLLKKVVKTSIEYIVK